MMDLTTFCLFLAVPVSLILLSHDAGAATDCRQCKPGYFASRLCSDTHDTVCSPCGPGTYTSHLNRFRSCSTCSSCDVGEFILKPCSLHSDTVCETCSSVIDAKSHAYLRDCVQNVQSDSIHSIDQLSDETIKLKDDNHKTKEKIVDHNINIYEGSGVPEFEEKNAVHDISDETVEGSGEVQIETVTVATTNQTSKVPIVIIPDEAYDKEEEIITKATDSNRTHKPTTESPITTKPTKVITIKEGIVLIDSGNATGTAKETGDVLLESKATSTAATADRSTTVKEGLIRPEEGIILQSRPRNDTKGAETETDEVIDVFIEENIPSDEPHFGASKSKGPESESGGISVGVFVAVIIICAAAFFVLGLMVNKYWGKRRSRSFNVEQAEKQNGQTFPDRQTIEYKDPEKSIPTKTGIYDEIPADKQNGKNGTGSHIKPAAADPVYSKPVKKQSNGMTNKANAESTGGADTLKDNEWGGMLVKRHPSSGSLIFSPAAEHPENENRNSTHSASIQYIDEEEPVNEETDKLLPEQPPTSQDEQKQTNVSSTSNNDINENGEELATEITPMISGDHDTINV